MKGTGETAAIYGYNKQYEIFANEIYNSPVVHLGIKK